MERSFVESISISNDVIFHVIFIVERFFWFINNLVEAKQQIVFFHHSTEVNTCSSDFSCGNQSGGVGERNFV